MSTVEWPVENVLEALRDLYKQATEERSHHYTGAVVAAAIFEIERLRERVRRLEMIGQGLRTQIDQLKDRP